MDIFSLEDEDISSLFITQESSGNVEKLMENSQDEEDGILGIAAGDFSSPCVSLVDRKENYNPEVSDISDDEKQFEPKR